MQNFKSLFIIFCLFFNSPVIPMQRTRSELPLLPQTVVKEVDEHSQVLKFRSGLYKNYKSQDAKYAALAAARHSETNEWFVVYRALYNKFDLSARPFKEFTERVPFEGTEVERFQFVSDQISSTQQFGMGDSEGRFRLGVYRDSNGLSYNLLAVARLEEDKKEIVVYRDLDGNQDLWVEPLELFFQKVQIDG